MSSTKLQKKCQKVLTSQTPMLPPCRICGQKASGFHYGVNTCEACKAFFRRNLPKGSLYRCIEDGNCEILPGKRNSCAACRFNKCVALGMCKEAIKTGRYTHEKKAEHINEVKQLESQQAKQMTTPKTTLPPKPPSPTQLSPLQLPSCVEPLSTPSSPTLSSPAQFSSNQTSPRVVSSSVSESNEELQNVIDFVVGSFLSTTPYNEEYFRLQPEREQKYLEEHFLQQQVFGPLKPLPKDEYTQFLQLTGIDADGRKEMFQSEIPHIEQAIKRFITFVKSIPGFMQLCMDDQITVIKNAKFEAWMFLCHGAFNTKHKLYCNQSGRVVGLDEMVKLNDREFVESIFAIQARIQSLKLTQEELCLICALVVMTTDECTVKDIAIIEDSQNLLLRCLFYMFQKNGHNETMKFSQFISCMMQLRTVKKQHKEAKEMLYKYWVGKIEFPPLLFEMWSS